MQEMLPSTNIVVTRFKMPTNTQNRCNLQLRPSFGVFLHKDSGTISGKHRTLSTVGLQGVCICQLDVLSGSAPIVLSFHCKYHGSGKS